MRRVRGEGRDMVRFRPWLREKEPLVGKLLQVSVCIATSFKYGISVCFTSLN